MDGRRKPFKNKLQCAASTLKAGIACGKEILSSCLFFQGRGSLLSEA